MAEQIGVISQLSGNYLLGKADGSGLVIVSNGVDHGLYSYTFQYGTKVTYHKLSGSIDIDTINDYGSVVAPNATMFYCLRFS